MVRLLSYFLFLLINMFLSITLNSYKSFYLFTFPEYIGTSFMSAWSYVNSAFAGMASTEM